MTVFRGKGRLFPPLDHLHSATLYDLVPGAFRQVGPPGWLEFMDDVGIDRAVLYPTGGLAVGKVINGDFAIEICQAYNNWFHDTYLKASEKFQGLGLIPMQEPLEAVKELRRIVEELGFCGAMLPSMGLKGHLGGKEYWPVYAEAGRLGCCLGVHGGAHEGLGMDYLTPYAPINGLGHPFGQMVGFAGFVFNGLFDRYPNMRVGLHGRRRRLDPHLPGAIRPRLGNPRPVRSPRRVHPAQARRGGERLTSAATLRRAASSSAAKAPSPPCTTPSKPWATSPSCSPATSPTR